MNLYGGLILGVNTLYRLFCLFKLFLMVGKGLKLTQLTGQYDNYSFLTVGMHETQFEGANSMIVG